MKKLLATTLIGLGLSVQAQTTNLNPGPFWTNGVTIYTNVQMGATLVPLTTNGYAGLRWAADSWNRQWQLSTTNRFSFRDAIAYGAFQQAEIWGKQARDEADAKADLVAIRQALPDATDGVIAQIKALLGL